MKLPNLLTVSRLVLAVLMMLLLSATFPFGKTLALVVFVIAALTDLWDGRLARGRYGITTFGQLMDPLADKVLVAAAFISFVDLQIVPSWIAVTIVGREFLVTGLRLLAASKGTIISAGYWGKSKTISQIVAIIVILVGLMVREDFAAWVPAGWLPAFNAWFPRVVWYVSVFTAVVTLYSGWRYVHTHREDIYAHF